MATVSKFEDLEIWQISREFCKEIYTITKTTNFSNDFRLKNQIIGAAGSIMDNIAEGFEREGNKEFIQFLYISKGSCGEVRSQLYRAFDNDYIDAIKFNDLKEKSIKISTSIFNFIQYLRKSNITGNKYKSSN